MIMENRMKNVEDKLDTVLEKMEIIDAREARRGHILDKLIDDEVQRQDMYRSIKKHVYGTGVIGFFTMVGAIIWFGIKAWLEKP